MTIKVNFEIQYITYLLYSATVLRFFYLIRWAYINCKYFLALLGLCIVFHKYFSRSKLYFITKQTNFFLFFQLDKGENEDGVYQASGSANIILYVGLGMIRDRPRFFDQIGHQTTNASIGNEYFFTK